MQTSRRRFFALTATVAAAVAIAPKAVLPEPMSLVPTEVFDGATWAFVPLQGGLRNIKKGQLFRYIHPEEGVHIPAMAENTGDIALDGPACWGVAAEDGYVTTDAYGNTCGGCKADFFTEGQEEECWKAAGFGKDEILMGAFGGQS